MIDNQRLGDPCSDPRPFAFSVSKKRKVTQNNFLYFKEYRQNGAKRKNGILPIFKYKVGRPPLPFES